MKLIETKIEGLALDMTTNTPVVILAPLELERVLPIWIGHAEAMGIAMELSGVAPKRPLTYDLLKDVIESLKATVDHVEITELRDQTFFAKVCLTQNGKSFELDARPSDSIALALKTGAKIMVNEELFNLNQDQSSDSVLPTDRESLRERLKKIDPEDFGKYTL